MSKILKTNIVSHSANFIEKNFVKKVWIPARYARLLAFYGRVPDLLMIGLFRQSLAGWSWRHSSARIMWRPFLFDTHSRRLRSVPVIWNGFFSSSKFHCICCFYTGFVRTEVCSNNQRTITICQNGRQDACKGAGPVDWAAKRMQTVAGKSSQTAMWKGGSPALLDKSSFDFVFGFVLVFYNVLLFLFFMWKCWCFAWPLDSIIIWFYLSALL